MTLPVVKPNHDLDLRDAEGNVVAKAYTIMTHVNAGLFVHDLGAAAGLKTPIGVVIQDGEHASLDSPSTLWVYDTNITDDPIIPDPPAEPVQA
jgi:hypothetical protein